MPMAQNPANEMGSSGMMTDRRIPVTLVSGFLGSGKTTIIRRLLAMPAFAHAAVIVNEFGDIDFNEVAFAHSGSEIVSANSGCFCCTARAGIGEAFAALDLRAQSHGPFEQVLIETSGLSAPTPILQAIINDPEIVAKYRLNGVIAIVDAITGLDSLNERREAREQIAFAGAIVLSKVDVADVQDMTLLRVRIAQFNAAAPIFESRDGDVDLQRLHAAAGAYEHAAPPPDGSDMTGGHDHAGGAVRSWTITRSAPATQTGLTLWMDLMAAYRGSEVLRMKGIVNVEGRPVAVESVRHVFHPPVGLAGWPDNDHRTRVVVIASGIDRKSIDDAFDALGFEQVAKPLDRQAYKRFQDVMSRMQSR
jgi:G3E family GTPase